MSGLYGTWGEGRREIRTYGVLMGKSEGKRPL